MTNSGWDVVAPQPARTILERTPAAQAAFDGAVGAQAHFDARVKEAEVQVVEGIATPPSEHLDTEPPSAAEVLVVDPDTGGGKGSKMARFDMIPADVLWEVAEHYGRGEVKYPGDSETGQANWQRGFAWHLSVAALQRHLYAWLSGEDVDEETGSNHLIAVIWHAIALRYFQKRGLGRDDIWTRRASA